MTLSERRAKRRESTSDPNASKSTQIPAIDQYWGIDESYAQAMLVKLEGISVVEAARLQAEFDAKAQADSDPNDAPYPVVNGIAVIPIAGPMTKRPTSAQFLTGGTSTMATRALLDKAEKDPSVKGVLLHIESPGGQVSGNSELADKVRGFSKPINAYIEDMGASCAYWVASQCNAIYANAMAEVGSIGVYGAVEDKSQMAAMLGVKVHLVKSGKYKGAGYPGTVVTDAHLADMQERVDELFGVFKDAVMAGRAMTADKLDPIADGRAFSAAKALEFGLIDGICSIEDCFATISGNGTRQPAIIAQDPARASDPRGQGTQMNLPTQVTDILARLKKVDKSALAAQGIDPDALGEFTSQGDDYASLKADMDRMKAAALNLAAENFWNELITPDVNGRAIATWSEKDYITGTYKTLAMLDGGGQMQYAADGSFAIGPNLKSFIEGNRKREKNFLQGTQIADADPRGRVPGLNTELMAAGIKRAKNSGRLDPKIASKVIDQINGGGQ